MTAEEQERQGSVSVDWPQMVRLASLTGWPKVIHLGLLGTYIYSDLHTREEGS